MTFDELDTRMRLFETAHDVCVLPGISIVARLDGRLSMQEIWDGPAQASSLLKASGFDWKLSFCGFEVSLSVTSIH